MKKPGSQAAFIERTLARLADAFEHAAAAEAAATKGGFLQKLDPRAKWLGVSLLVIAAIGSHPPFVPAALLLISCGLAALSRISFRALARVWLAVLLFTGAIALPAVFTTPGAAIWRLPWLGWPVSTQGLRTASHLLLRSETSSTLVLLLVLSTPWNDLLKALRSFRVPAAAVLLLGMTHRYIFLLLQLAREQFDARRSRMIGPLDAAQARRISAGSAGVLLEKSVQLSSEVYLAMQARGFRGEIKTLDDFQMKPRDWVSLAGAVLIGAFALMCSRALDR